MFDELYTDERWRRRQAEGPLAKERQAFLQQGAAQGDARNTLLHKARRTLILARILQEWPADRLFTQRDLDRMEKAYWNHAQRRRPPADPKDVGHKFRFLADQFLRFLGRLAPSANPVAVRYSQQLEAYIKERYLDRDAAEQTIKARRLIALRFLGYLDAKGRSLDDATPQHIDDFLHALGQKWSRRSMSHAAYGLSSWIGYCESREWVRSGLAASILKPKVYQQERLPLGPTWKEIALVVENLSGRLRKLLRDRAIILLLSVYGLRAGEVCRMEIGDVDWQKGRLRLRRSKISRESEAPLEPNVGQALLAYYQFGRPASSRPELFLAVQAPLAPLTSSGICSLVKQHSARVLGKGWNSHALRHACARHLLAQGFTLKRIADHLGHGSQRSTTVYAKVDLLALREVAMQDLGGLL